MIEVPVPEHAIINNFLPSDTLELLSETFLNIDDLKNQEKFSTLIERKTILTG